MPRLNPLRDEEWEDTRDFLGLAEVIADQLQRHTGGRKMLLLDQLLEVRRA